MVNHCCFWLRIEIFSFVLFTPSSHTRKKPAKSKTNTSGNRNSNESHGSHEKSSRSKTVRRVGGGITDNEQSVDRVSQDRSNHNITAYQQQHSECNL